MLLSDLQAVLFLKNPKIRQPFAQNPSAGHQIEPLPQFDDKNPVQRYRKIIHIFVHSNWHFCSVPSRVHTPAEPRQL